MSEPTPKDETAPDEPTPDEPTPKDEPDEPTPDEPTPKDEAAPDETATGTSAAPDPSPSDESPEASEAQPAPSEPAPSTTEPARVIEPAPSPPAATPPPSASPAPQLGTRLVGLAWLLVFGVAGFVLVRRVYGHDFGTTNTRVLSVIRLASLVLTAYPALLGLMTLLTGKRPPARLNPLGLPLNQWWYQGLNALTWRELKRVFFHPVAYIVLFVYLLINGILLANLINHFSGPNAANAPYPAAYFLTSNWLLWISLILICPALTMRLLAEERRSKSLELLLTAPVTETQVVLSKFGAVWLYFLFMTSFTLGYAGLIETYAVVWDWGPVLSGFLGLALIGSLATAIGVFTSAMTKSQILAYLISALLLLVLLLIIGQLIQPGLPSGIRSVLEYISIDAHQNSFASGIVSWRSLTYFLTSTGLFLFLAVRGLAAQGGR